MVSSPTPSPLAPAVDPSGEPSSTPEAAKLVATCLVPVSGPNLTGKVPPLDKSRAIASQVGAVTIAADYVPGQWYDHYAYYTLDGTEVEQYTSNDGEYAPAAGPNRLPAEDRVRIAGLELRPAVTTPAWDPLSQTTEVPAQEVVFTAVPRSTATPRP